jgi:hypothetical protein
MTRCSTPSSRPRAWPGLDPGLRSSREPGPMTTNLTYRTVVMGPRLRGDDEDLWNPI